MKNLNKLFVFGLFLFLVAFTSDVPKSYIVNTEHSKVKWTGFKVGGEHKGEVNIKETKLDFKGDTLVGGEFVVDMASVTCTYIEDADKNKQLVNHLKSNDSFDVTNHPTVSYVINKVIPYGKEQLKDKNYTKSVYKVSGDLTIKGITKPFKTQVDIYNYGTSISAVSRLEIDRSDFDIRYGSGSFFDNLGDKLIYDEIRLDVNIAASGQ